MRYYFVTFGVSLLLTWVVESAVFLLWGNRHRRDFLLLVLVNLLTNPAVVLLHLLLVLRMGLPALPVVALLEVGAVLVEAHYYTVYAEAIRRPLIFAAVANGVSYGCGVLLQLMF